LYCECCGSGRAAGGPAAVGGGRGRAYLRGDVRVQRLHEVDLNGVGALADREDVFVDVLLLAARVVDRH
jgi:hypothetical protein